MKVLMEVNGELVPAPEGRYAMIGGRIIEIRHEPKKDQIVKRVLKLFKERSKQGIETYGTTLQENNLSTLEWINEAQAEAMDFCLYLEKLKDKIKEYDNERENTN